MKKILVRINSIGKINAFSDRDEQGKPLKVKPNQAVLVETEDIVEEGRTLDSPPADVDIEDSLGQILRAMTSEDRCRQCELKNLARGFIEEGQTKVFRHNLKMTILDADLSFDQKKLTFYFSAKGRVDFRGLVLDLAKTFQKIIRLQQVGAREEARLFGGIGRCGRELCCAKFLNNLENINLEMAQVQELAPQGVGKITGCCGKLMCCLSYELGNYQKTEAKVKKEKKI